MPTLTIPNKPRNSGHHHHKSNKIHYKRYNANKNHSNHRSLIYNIKIGEKNFCLTPESLKHDEPNFFTAAFFGPFSESKTNTIFLERDPINFIKIVKYLRGYEVDWPINDRTSMRNLLEDVKFYAFGRLQFLLEEIYEKHFPEKVIPWKILTYTPENDPVVAINIKDVALERWDGHSLIYNINPILNVNTIKSNDDDYTNYKDVNDDVNDEINDDTNNDDNNHDHNNNDETINDNDNDDDNNNDANNLDDNDNVTNNDVTENDNEEDNVVNDGESVSNNESNPIVIEPNPEKGLYRLEIHGRGALATVISNWNNGIKGIKFENFVLKDPAEEATFRVLTQSFRTPEGSLTLSPSLKLSFLKDACIELDGSKYYDYQNLLDYFGANSRGKPLYFEEIVIRIDGGVFLMRARAWTFPSYYASQPFIHSVKS